VGERWMSQATIDKIDELLEDDQYAWAFTTLCGIRETITRTGKVTEGQAYAINNIRNAVSIQQRQAITGELPSDRYKGSRRYEGFSSTKRKEL
jgi:hypothetical protein